MSDEEVSSGNASNTCGNPACQYILEQYSGIEKKTEHELWRAAQAINRARALRACAAVVLYITAVYHIIFSADMWARAGAVAMVVICFRAMHSEG